ncbi:Sugar ABC transporter, ATP-binding protein) [Alteracholeplasma palmae J233]|uniref:Sugar ABC transporter, ATP-binding protein n=1 Tax=Alteracholeplasma palmae (strain ATCC 49389 / J233) TaxID=1318466 RepID=U4KQQ7_ALTPJ|nr:ABC transporter ATP-binding protein [Alteracholeplasma palmae]CCV65000.1 Sugar ABC transporter, ATP-binding protein) [Alteracholeplasma palmae J233]
MEIRLENLTKVFTDAKSKSETRAVDDMTITIPSGKLVGLLGPSGCGKSTTLYMIAGLLNPTGGKIFFGEDDVTDLAPEKRGIGLVFQNYALYPHMTIRQNIMFPLENLKVPKEEAKALTLEMAKLVGIEDQLDKKPGQLSGGQQQRVAIARALVKKPKVLLLDEPLSNLDARLRLQTREEIKRIQRETGITTIFVTHDQEEAMSISDEIVLMEKGVVKQIGGPQEVYENPTNLFVAKFLGTPPIAVYNGSVSKGKVKIGKTTIFSSKELEETEVEAFIAIRPEGYEPAEKGKLKVSYDFIENIGRDLALIAHQENAINPTFRIILQDQNGVTPSTTKFNIKKEKCYVFNKETGERVL